MLAAAEHRPDRFKAFLRPGHVAEYEPGFEFARGLVEAFAVCWPAAQIVKYLASQRKGHRLPAGKQRKRGCVDPRIISLRVPGRFGLAIKILVGRRGGVEGRSASASCRRNRCVL